MVLVPDPLWPEAFCVNPDLTAVSLDLRGVSGELTPGEGGNRCIAAEMPRSGENGPD